jgi:hypothetical protein
LLLNNHFLIHLRLGRLVLLLLKLLLRKWSCLGQQMRADRRLIDVVGMIALLRGTSIIGSSSALHYQLPSCGCIAGRNVVLTVIVRGVLASVHKDAIA